MAADESALVPIAPDDTIDSIVAKVRATSATNVELLVPDGTAALQSLGGFERLRQALEPNRVELLVISSDQNTLDAARLSKIETVGVQGARVMSPARSNGDVADRYETQTLPAEPIDARDAAFLSALDQVRPGDRYADLQEEDADLYAALDDLSDTIQQSGSSGRRSGGIAEERGRGGDEDFAAALDEWSQPGVDQAATRPSARPDREPPRRFSAADMDLTEEDAARQRQSRRTTAQSADAEAKAAAGGALARRQRGRTTGRLRDYDEEDALAPRRSRLSALIPLAIVLVVVLALAFWLLSSRATIIVAPPAAAGSQHPFKNEVIPLAQLGENTKTAVQATAVSADADATSTGQIQKETLSPVGTAKGEVTIINTIGSAVPIPKGAEFIGKNAKGEEVRFAIDNDVTVPGATTTRSLTGSSTTYGQVNVALTARSPGSASNVDANSITQLLIPGQQPIVSQNSNFIFQNAPIGGGSEQPQRIVTEADVQAVLGQALTSLYANGVQQLRSKIDETKAGIDATTITPSANDLGDPKNYEAPVVEPPIGQPVDPNNPVFKVTVRAHFNALATPANKGVADQLGEVVKNNFAQRATPCKAGEIPAQRVDAWRWDGEKLTIDGAVNCLPPKGLSPEALGKVKDAVKGQSRDAAEAGLQTLQKQGVIGSYQLPDKASFSRFDWLISVEVAEPQPAEQRPTPQPQPTQGTQ